MTIQNFTTVKDGYYWCQIVANDSYLKPSQYAWFYAADRSSCTQELYFVTASESEIQCAENDINTNTVITETTNTIKSATIIAPSTTYSTYYVTTTFPTTSNPMILSYRTTQLVLYVAAFFSVLLVLLGALVIILLLLLCVHKNKSHRKKIQIKGEPMYFLHCDFRHAHVL